MAKANTTQVRFAAWQRVGVRRETSPLRCACLGRTQPEVDSLRQMIDSEGEALRVKIKWKETRKYFIRVEQNVPVHPRHAEVFVHVTNLQKQLSKEAKVAEVRVYDEAPSLVDRIAITGDKLTIHPRKSFRAGLIAGDYQVPIQLDLAALGVA